LPARRAVDLVARGKTPGRRSVRTDHPEVVATLEGDPATIRGPRWIGAVQRTRDAAELAPVGACKPEIPAVLGGDVLAVRRPGRVCASDSERMRVACAGGHDVQALGIAEEDDLASVRGPRRMNALGEELEVGPVSADGHDPSGRDAAVGRVER